MADATNRTSYWQQGCDDGKAARPKSIPLPWGSYWNDRANEGYVNGYRFGQRQYLASLGSSVPAGVKPCGYCNGTGEADASGHGDVEPCAECGGTGEAPHGVEGGGNGA